MLPKAEYVTFCNGDAPRDEGLVSLRDVKIHKLQHVGHMLQFMNFCIILFFCVLMAVCFCKASELLIWMLALFYKAFNCNVSLNEQRRGEVTL